MSDKNGAVKAKRKRAQRFEPGTPDVASLAASYGYDNCLVHDGSALSVGVPQQAVVHVEAQRATKKIAIVGKAPSTIEQAPFDDPEWEIWGLSDLMLHPACKRWSRWFELHDPEGWHPDDTCPRRQKWHPKYWEFLTAAHDKPIYVREPHPEIKAGIPLPYEMLERRFCLRDEHDQPVSYFTNTVSWMLAMALAEGATHISVFGVDMAQQEKGVKSEYAYQRPSCEYFIGVAHGMGVKVFIPKDADLMKASRRYAIDALSPNARSAHRKRTKDLRKMAQQNDAELAQLERQLQEKRERRLVLAGALDDTQNWWGQQIL